MVRRCASERDRAAASAQDREARLELLRYHLRRAARRWTSRPARSTSSTAERQRLSQRGRLAAGAREILQLLREAEDVNAEHAVSRALTVCALAVGARSRASPRSPRLIDECLIALREGVEAVGALRIGPRSRSAATGMGGAAARRASKSIARKHRVEPAALGALHAELAAEFQQLDTLEASLEQIEKKLDAAADAVSRRVRQAQRRARRGRRQAVASGSRR